MISFHQLAPFVATALFAFLAGGTFTQWAIRRHDRQQDKEAMQRIGRDQAVIYRDPFFGDEVIK